VGAFAGGGPVARYGGHRGLLLRNTAAAETVLLAAATLTTALAASPLPGAVRIAVAALAALALGVQNATIRTLKVPDLTTTVLTMTLTGVVADARHGSGRVRRRRVLAIISMFAGAAVGATLVLQVGPGWALTAATLTTAVVAGGAALASRRPAAWQAARG